MPRSRYVIHDEQEPHFLTCTVHNRVPVFTRPDATDIVLDSLRFLQENGRLVVYGYVVMVNHIHLVASSPELTKTSGEFKSHTARRILTLLQANRARTLLWQLTRTTVQDNPQRQRHLWRPGSHPQQILSEDMMRQKLEYIHNNPVARGHVDDPLHWRYSSARNYEGKDALLSVMTDW